jgi:hypothetical protein
MKPRLLSLAMALVAVSAGTTGIDTAHRGVSAQLAADVVLTDPMVRSIQIGPPPVGAVTGLNAATGIAAVAVPGIGLRRAQLMGAPVAWAGRRLVRAIDLDTSVEFVAMLPEPPQLARATVTRATGDTILVRRTARGAIVTEAVPVGSVFALRNGQLSPATRVPGSLRRGATVMIPADPATWARVIVRSPR